MEKRYKQRSFGNEIRDFALHVKKKQFERLIFTMKNIKVKYKGYLEEEAGGVDAWEPERG